MNKLAGLILLITSFNSTAQTNSVTNEIAKPAITAIGKPEGEKRKTKLEKKVAASRHPMEK